MVLGLTAVSAFAGKGQFLKAIMMTILGLMLATVGTDAAEGLSGFGRIPIFRVGGVVAK